MSSFVELEVKLFGNFTARSMELRKFSFLAEILACERHDGKSSLKDQTLKFSPQISYYAQYCANTSHELRLGAG
jgi:hypothetical protein